MKRYTFLFLTLLVAVSMVLAACQPATEAPPAEETEEPVVTEEVTEEPEETEEPQETEEVEDVGRVEGQGAYLDRIVVSVVDSASAVTQIQAGAIDIYASQLSSAQLPEIEEAGLEYGSSNGLYYELTINPVGPIFGEDEVNPFVFDEAREALNWLVDRDQINREVYNGGALPKFASIVTQFPDYATVASTMRAIESEYAYDMDRAQEAFDAVMQQIPGVTIEDGMYMYNGEQVTLKMLIRNDSDGTRVPIGDYVANQLEEIGFATDRQYRSSSEASPIWIFGDPAEGLWHLYTGAWSATIIDRDEGDNFQFFDTPQSAYGFSALWQAFGDVLSDRYIELADALAYNKFDTRAERNEALEEMLWLAMEESIHVWLIDGKGFIPWQENVDATYDLAAGVDGSMIWPYTLRFADQIGGTMSWGQPDLFVDPWNPIAGSNWAFDQAIGRATWGEAYMIDPHTGLLHPQRFERAEITAVEGLPIGKTLDWVSLDFEEEIQVPEDAIMDWDAEAQAFITAAEKLDRDVLEATEALAQAESSLDAAQIALDELPDDATEEEETAANDAVAAAEGAIASAQADLEAAEAQQEQGYFTSQVKSVVFYPESLWDEIKWHDGSPITLADFLYSWIISLDMGKPASPIYDEAYAANAAAILANFKGMRILSEDPLTVEAYSDSYQTDAELNITTLWPSFDFGEAPWHVLTMGALADTAGEVAFSADKAEASSTDTVTVEWLSLIGGPSLEVLQNFGNTAIEEQYIPYANVLADYITAEEAVARYENALTFFDTYGHFNIGTGPYILEEAFLPEKIATLLYNPMFPDANDKWARFGEPMIANVTVEGPDTVILGEEAVFDVFVTFNDEPYASDQIKSVSGLLYDATGELVLELSSEMVAEGQYTITIPVDADLVDGSSRLEAVVVPLAVAIPTFQSYEFVTIQ